MEELDCLEGLQAKAENYVIFWAIVSWQLCVSLAVHLSLQAPCLHSTDNRIFKAALCIPSRGLSFIKSDACALLKTELFRVCFILPYLFPHQEWCLYPIVTAASFRDCIVYSLQCPLPLVDLLLKSLRFYCRVPPPKRDVCTPLTSALFWGCTIFLPSPHRCFIAKPTSYTVLNAWHNFVLFPFFIFLL
jgi:hypothetical protein